MKLWKKRREKSKPQPRPLTVASGLWVKMYVNLKPEISES